MIVSQEKKIEARNALDSYVHQVKKAASDEKVAAKISEEDKKEIESAVSEAQQWLEKNISAEKDEIEHKRQEFEKRVTPIMTKIYQGAQQGGEGMPGGFGAQHQSGGPGFGSQQGTTPGTEQKGTAAGPKIEEVD